MDYQQTLGAWMDNGEAHFRIWAPEIDRLELILEPASGPEVLLIPERNDEGIWEAKVPEVRAGDRYCYRVNGQGPFPDPASRFQPEGVHGSSQIIDPTTFEWNDDDWEPLTLRETVLYELHVGTFTPEGTFNAIVDRIPYLVDLGITAIELMPVADFPGDRNWGYDGVSIYAPARCYGTPDELRRLVNEAHNAGLAVHLDVVYNHLGPDGNYTGVYSSHYLTKKHKTPWGDGLNFDGPQCTHLRHFFLENAKHWLHDYHIDGLRLDATHAILDDSDVHFLAQLTDELRASCGEQVILIAEDHRNLAQMMVSTEHGGWGLDGVWADDYHHQNRRLLHGDSDGYFRDFTGTTEDLATTIRQGWFYTGQFSEHLNENRGSDPTGLDPSCFVICLQNHDQIGNRAFGERLHHQIDPAAWRAASALFLCTPETPLLCMGQEWATTSPFLFFTDHNDELGPQVTAGRREEFKRFKAFSDPEKREQIPDPQAKETFEKSKLQWGEQGDAPHRGVLRLYQNLLQLRREHPALRERGAFQVDALDEDVIQLTLSDDEESLLMVVCRLRGSGEIAVPGLDENWEVVLTTEDIEYCEDGQAPEVDLSGRIVMQRPGAVLLQKSE